MRLHFFCISRQLCRFIQIFPNPAPSALHEFHTVEQVCNHRISAGRVYFIEGAILNRFPSVHPAWRIYFQTVIIHIYVDFAADHQINTVYQSIYQRFCHSAF